MEYSAGMRLLPWPLMPWGWFNIKMPFTSIGNPIVEIRRSYEGLIFTMEFPILVKGRLYIEPAPWFLSSPSHRQSLCFTLQWRHNDHNGVSNHQPRGCLLNRLFGRRCKKKSKLRVTGLWAGKSPGPVNSPHKGSVTRKMFHFYLNTRVPAFHEGSFQSPLPFHPVLTNDRIFKYMFFRFIDEFSTTRIKRRIPHWKTHAYTSIHSIIEWFLMNVKHAEWFWTNLKHDVWCVRRVRALRHFISEFV